MKHFVLLFLTGALCASPLHAEEGTVTLLKEQFLALKFGPLAGDAEMAEIARLHELADKQISEGSTDPMELMVRARILGYHASLIGGLKALPLVKESKKLLESSLEIDEKAWDGYGHVMLGLLYSRVPSFPIAFGNNKKAGEHFRKAIEIDPTGYESNFSYAEFLSKKRKVDQVTVQKQLQAAKSGLSEDEFARAEKIRRIDEMMTKVSKT